jgi:hypothetical protein
LELNYNDDNGDVVTCGYPKCRKKGHTQEFCRLKKKHQEISAAKRKRNTASGGKEDIKSDDLRQIPGSKVYSGCPHCSFKAHLAEDCKKRKKVADPAESKDNGISKKKENWRDYANDNSDDDN